MSRDNESSQQNPLICEHNFVYQSSCDPAKEKTFIVLIKNESTRSSKQDKLAPQTGYSGGDRGAVETLKTWMGSTETSSPQNRILFLIK